MANMTEFIEFARRWRAESFRTGTGASVNAYGTAGDLPTVHELGDLPVKNFLTGVFPEYEKLSGRYMRTNFKMRRNPCFSCTLAHCHLMEVPNGPHGGTMEEPEYEDMSNLGSNIGLSDPGEVAWLTDYTDRLGFDGNWAGAVVGWGMEAYERGVITKQALGGLELRWGDVDAAAELLRMIAYREGIGDTLALGLKTGAERIGGKEAAAFAVHIKGETNHAHDMRALWGVFLGLCISGAGPRWESESVDLAPDPEIGITEPQDRFKVEGKADAARRTQLKKLFIDSLGVCSFGVGTMDTMVKAYTALTGWPLTIDGAYFIGERVANVQRAFNVRHGFRPEFDLDVSPRLLEAPPDGGAKGKSIAPYLKGMVQEYNTLMDWDWETGRPSHAKLKALGLEEVEKSLYA
jgi:aldehyde:ferredoxin oxidoreductase